jgi:glycine cleavage system regulatory protein
MSNDTDQIVRRFAALFLEQQSTLRNLARNDLLFIEACQSGVSPRALAAAAQAVREALYSVDSLTDKVRAISDEIQRS